MLHLHRAERADTLADGLADVLADPLDDPFRGTAEVLAKHRLGATVQAIVADFHTEATSEKMAYAHSFDGAVSLVVGTHTHCPSADHHVLAGGTAFQSDAGMCGDYDSVLGMQKDEPLRRFLQKTPGARFEPAQGEGTLTGIAVETDAATGLAIRVSAVRLGPHLEETWPREWD